MKRVAVLFPPKTKYSSKLYFRSQQIVDSLRRHSTVVIEGGISETGNTSGRQPVLILVLKFIGRIPSIVRTIARSDTVLLVPTFLWYIFIPVAKFYKKPIVLDHFTTYLSHSDYIRTPLVSSCLRWLDKRLFRSIGHVITHTETMRQDLAAYYNYPKSQISVLYSVVDTDLFDPERISKAEIHKIRAELGIPSANRVVMYHGARHAFHGVEIIEQAARLLEDEAITVLLLGDPAPEHIIAKNLIYQPYMPFDQLPKYLAVAEIWLGRFASPERDVRGNRMASSCMFQAMAMAKPIVTATSVESQYALNEGECGILISPDNPHQLAQTIRRILSHPEEGKRLGEAGRKRICREFSLKIVDRTIDQAIAFT